MSSTHSVTGLGWVKTELGEVIRQVRVALEEYVEGSGDAAQLKRCEEQLQQVRGVLQMLELQGAARLVQEMMALASAVLKENRPHSRDGVEALMLALIQLPDYLEKLSGGEPDVPLVLLPSINDLRASRGAELLTEADLFAADLALAPSAPAPSRQSSGALTQVARRLRPKYHRGLIEWYRDKASKAGLVSLRDLFRELSERAQDASLHELFRAAYGVSEGLLGGGIASTREVKSLLGKFDRPLRILAESAAWDSGALVDPKLRQELLFLLAQVHRGSAVALQVKSELGLDHMVPAEAELESIRARLSAPNADAMAGVGAAVAKELIPLKDTLDLYIRGGRGHPDKLLQIEQPMRRLADILSMVGRDDLCQRLRQDADEIGAIASGQSEVDDGRLMRLAGDFLYVESMLENLSAGRHGAIAGAHSGAPALPAMELRKVLGNTLQEAGLEMAKAKDAIVTYLAAPADIRPLDELPDLFHGISGALGLLSETEAAELLDGIARYVRQALLEGTEIPDKERLDALAEAISGIEYYMEALAEERGDRSSILRMVREALDSLETGRRLHIVPSQVPEAVPQEVVSQVGIEIEEIPLDEAESGFEETALLADETEMLGEPIPAPIELETIDPEFLDIFIDEAREALEVIQPYFARWKTDPTDADALSTIRRSFHTLKGSGRMVGAETIGEFAWSVENLLNRVIDRTLSLSDDILDFVGHAVAVLPELIEGQASGAQPRVDVPTLVARGEALATRASKTVEAESADHKVIPLPLAEAEAAAEAPTGVEAFEEDSELLGIFAEEAREHLLELREFSRKGHDRGGPTVLDEGVVRALHTLAGSARMAGIAGIPEVAKAMERYSARALEQGVAAGAGFLTLLDDVVSGIETIVSALGTPGAATPDLEQILPRIEAADLGMAFQVVGADVSRTEVPESEVPEAEARRAEAPEAEVPTAKIPEPEIPAAEIPAAKIPAAKIPEPEIPAAEIPAAEIPAADVPAAKIPEPEVPAAEIPAAEIPAAEVPEAEIPQPEIPAAEIPAAKIPEAEIPQAEISEAEIPEAEIPEAEIPEAEIPEAEIPEAEIPEEEVPAAAGVVAAEEELEEYAGDEELLDIFLEEAQELLDRMDAEVQVWEAGPSRATSVAALQRILHTLKGGARLAGITAIGDLSHALESLLTGLGNDAAETTGETVALAQQVIDRLSEQIDSVRNRQPVRRALDLIPMLRQPLSGAIGVEPARPTARPPAPVDTGAVPAPEVADEGVPEEPAWTVAVTPAVPEAELEEVVADRELLGIFLEESQELLDQLDEKVGVWEANPVDDAPVAGLQRILHTLKGGARLAGITAIGDLSHALESLLTGLGGDGVAMTGDIVRLAQQAIDRLSDQVDAVRNRRPVRRAADMIAILRGVLETGAAVASEDLSVESPAIVEPPAPETEAAPARAVESRTKRVASGAPPPQQKQELVRVRSNLLDRLVNNAGEISIYRARLEEQNNAVRFNLTELEQTVTRLHDQLRQLEIETETQILFRYEREHDEVGNAIPEFDPLELDRFSTMQQLSRSLMEAVNDLRSIKGLLEDQQKGSETLLLQQARISNDLQDGLLRTRMVPFAQVVPRLQRLVRQTANSVKKRALLDASGVEGEIDRGILERMVAPMEHILRNAVSHGIESPERRVAAGKNATGRVSLYLTREGNDVVLTVSDDGAGLNLEAIRQRAIERGLLAAGAEIPDDDVMQFILEPGFSTTSKVTQISGRGVGTDVVVSEVKQLGGSLEIASHPGRGTSFSIRLPLTLAITEALLVEISEEIYAVPHTTVEGVVRIGRTELETCYSGRQTHFSYAGHDYQVRYLGALLGSGVALVSEGRKWFPLLLVRSGEHRFALQVDRLLGNQQIVVKSVGPQLSTVRWVSGGTILADGRVALIMDVTALVRMDVVHTQSVEAVREEEPVQELCVMVVDDSITVRKVTTRLLKRHNMEVVTAKDGVDAVAELQERIPDIMLLDIEMPRMDGYELARHMRNSERLRGVPIIMITSRSGEKHRRLAFEVGVSRYLGKPYQETDLLDNIYSVLAESRA